MGTEELDVALAREQELRERVRVFGRIQEALVRLRDVGSVDELIARAPAEVARACDMDRAVVYRVDGGMLVAEAFFIGGDDARAADLLAFSREHPLSLREQVLESRDAARAAPDRRPRRPAPPAVLQAVRATLRDPRVRGGADHARGPGHRLPARRQGAAAPTRPRRGGRARPRRAVGVRRGVRLRRRAHADARAPAGAGRGGARADRADRGDGVRAPRRAGRAGVGAARRRGRGARRGRHPPRDRPSDVRR